MKTGDYSSIHKAIAYRRKRFQGNLAQISKDELKYLDSFVKSKLREGFSALDLGAGTGRITTALFKLGAIQVFALDPSKSMLDELQKTVKQPKKAKLKIIISLADNIPLPGKSLDLITAFHLFKHIKHLNPVIKESSRVAKNGAYFIFDALNRNSIISLNLADCFAVSKTYLEKVLNDNGFKLLKVHYLHFLGESIYNLPFPRIFHDFDQTIARTGLGTKILVIARKQK